MKIHNAASKTSYSLMSTVLYFSSVFMVAAAAVFAVSARQLLDVYYYYTLIGHTSILDTVIKLVSIDTFYIVFVAMLLAYLLIGALLFFY